MRATRRTALGLVGVLGAAISWADSARSDTVEACVAAVSAGQKLERAGALRAARETLLSCDKSECPQEVRTVCDRLVNQVEASVPTIILGAKDSGGDDLVSVRVSADGVLLSASMDGKAVAMDPGHHVLLFERDGSAPIERDVVLREGDKNRAVVVTFVGDGSRATVPAAAARERAAGRPAPALAYALGAVGAASLGAFIALDADGQSRFSACEAHGCPSSLGTERAFAFGAGGLAIASLAAATWLFLARPRDSGTAAGPSLGLSALRDGAVLVAGGRF